MAKTLIQYLIVVFTALILDSVWLGLVAKDFYRKYIGFMMSPTPDLKVALLFYLVFAAAIMVFILAPAFSGSYSLCKVLLYGALLGLTIYGGYDFTNQALIKDWPWIVTLADLAWGTAMSALTAGISYSIIKTFR